MPKLRRHIEFCAKGGLLLAVLLFAAYTHAQGNYEIQVYGADTVEPKNLMVELHSNFTPESQKRTSSTASIPLTIRNTRPSN